jgi:uncharacterized protein YegP (UPF0339 family)
VPLPVSANIAAACPNASDVPSAQELAKLTGTDTDTGASRVQFQLFTDASGKGVRWRLLSGNRREIGRSMMGYPTVGECEIGIDWMRTHLADLTTRIQRSDAGGWSWELLCDGEPVVACGRRFDRQIRCAQALALFRELAPEAAVHTTVMLAQARRGAGERVRLGAVPSSPTNRTGARR